MKVFRCDRCNAIYEMQIRNEGDVVLCKVKDGNSARLDLCPNCLYSLEEWLYKPEQGRP